MLQPISGKRPASEARLWTQANGAFVTFSGIVRIDMANAWLDKVVKVGKVNWLILNISEMSQAQKGVWASIEVGLKKLQKKGVQRIVVVWKDKNLFAQLKASFKRVGLLGISEYIDTNKRPYNQKAVASWLQQNWDKAQG